MNRFIAVASAAIVFLCAASAASAQRDSVERGTRMDTDALRDDVRTNRLQVPSHPLAAEQPAQPAPVQKEKPSSSKAEGAVNSAGSVEGISRDLLVSLLVSSKRTLSILLHNR
jgi:hypothetical protein